MDGNGIVYANGFGYADVEKRTPVTTETLFNIGSITKTLTAAAAMQLVEAGRIDLDKPLQIYLPAFSVQSPFPNAAPITPRNLLQPEDLNFPPDYLYSYSNVAMGLLGHALQNAAGTEWTTYMQTKLFEPLAMKATFNWMGQELATKWYSGDQEVAALPIGDLPAGGIMSNVLDMSNYAQTLLNGGRFGNQVVLRPESIAEMFRPQITNAPAVATLTADEIKQFEGDYAKQSNLFSLVSANGQLRLIDNAIQLSTFRGYLVITESSQKVRTALSLIADDQAVTVGLWRAGGDRIRFVQRGGEERLLWSGYELRKNK